MAEINVISMLEKTTPEATDFVIIEDTVAPKTKKMSWPNLVKPVKDLIGDITTLTTSLKTNVVIAINEIVTGLGALTTRVGTLESNATKYVEATIESVAGQNYASVLVPYPTGFTSSNCQVFAMARGTLNSRAIFPYQASNGASGATITFTSPAGNFSAVATQKINVLFVRS